MSMITTGPTATGSTDDTTDDSTDSTTDSTTSDETFESGEEELIEASLGDDADTTSDDVTGSVVLAGGGATTAAGSTATSGSTEIDPSASRNVADDAEGSAPGDDPDVDADEAFQRAQAALEDAAPSTENVTVAGRQVHPLLILGVSAAAYGGYKAVGG